MQALGLRCVVDEGPEAAAEAGGVAEGGRGLFGVEPQHARRGGGRAEGAAGRGRMPAAAVVRRIAAAGFEHAPAEVIAEHDSGDQLSPRDRAVSGRQCRDCCRQHDGAGVVAAAGVVEFECMRGDAVGHGGIAQPES